MQFKKYTLFFLFFFYFLKGISQQQSIVLGRPTDTSITASILFDQNVQYYLEYGTQSGVYTNTSIVYTNVLNVPDEIDLTGLISNTQYYYRMKYKLVST